MTNEEQVNLAQDLVAAHGSVRAASRASGIPRTTLRGWLTKGTAIAHERLVEKIARCPELPIAIDDEAELYAVLADVHWPYTDSEAMETAVAYLKKLPLKGVVLLGDAVDMYSVSSFRKDPTMPSFADELASVRKSLHEFDEALPGVHKVLVKGNHEQRFEDYIMTKTPELYELGEVTLHSMLHLDKMGWGYVDNKALLLEGLPPFSIGDVFLLHGHEVDITASAVNLARLFYQRVLVNVMFGHYHVISAWRQNRLDQSVHESLGIGCLCKKAASYRPFTNWHQGFAIIEVGKDGTTNVFQKRISNRRVL